MAGDPPVLDRPWRRSGARKYALARLRSLVAPPVTVFDPAPGTLIADRDVAVATRDGTILRVNVYRPIAPGPVPVLMSAHPYGKDKLPSRKGRRSRVSIQYHVMQQSAPISQSTLTSWEAPDPQWWVGQGYAVVNADLRGAGTSDGVGDLMSDQEAEDVYDLIEWAGAQPWSSGNVGLLGVSYLAMSQYKAAALRPPSLKAICPWEGMTDAYRDLMRPGGLREDGFTRVWAAGTRRAARLRTDMGKEQQARPLRDDWWQSLVPDLGRIETPMLVCTSFSDNNLHSRGSFRAFEQVGSADRFAYTHRAGKWATFYGEEALGVQARFFDRYLRGADVARPAPVRLEVREDRHTVAAVRSESEWPLARTQWRALYLAPGGALQDRAVERPGQLTFNPIRRAAAFTLTVPEDLELSGPMSVRVWVEAHGADDVTLVAGVEKWRGGRYVGFEGSYGFGRDRVSTGWQRAALRELDSSRSLPGRPEHTYRTVQPLAPGLVVPVDIALGPSATLFRAGESVRLVVAGRWLWPRNPLTGQFPAHYRHNRVGRITLHWGPDRPAQLIVPVIPQ
jgi:uncharacterized protein